MHIFGNKSAQSDDRAAQDKQTKEIHHRLLARHKLMEAAEITKKTLPDDAAAALQLPLGKSAEDTDLTGTTPNSPTPGVKEIAEAVRYRLSITDLFVEKAQYHLAERAEKYTRLGERLYRGAIFLLVSGTFIAVWRLFSHRNPSPLGQSQPNTVEAWINLLAGFITAFTAYGFIVLTAVALIRGARACYDQRERLFAKRHSLRQGRLFLHLRGGSVTIEEIEAAFNWNHTQSNAFTHMPTDMKAPWGSVVEEIVKLAPRIFEAGATAAQEASDKLRAPRPSSKRDD